MTHTSHTHVSLLTTFKSITSEHVIFEMLKDKDIKNIENLIDHNDIIKSVRTHFKIKDDTREKSLVFAYGKS